MFRKLLVAVQMLALIRAGIKEEREEGREEVWCQVMVMVQTEDVLLGWGGDEGVGGPERQCDGGARESEG